MTSLLVAGLSLLFAGVPKVGDKAPAFELPDQNGVKHTLAENKGHWVALAFYPKDGTPG